MTLHEEHALLKVLNKLYPETKDMTTPEIICFLNAISLVQDNPNPKGINEIFKTAVTRFTDCRSNRLQ